MITRRRMMLIHNTIKYIVTSVNGIVSFVTDIIRSVKVTCNFVPIQSGTGDPSPSNVRTISGWTGCNIYEGLAYILEQGSLTSNGTNNNDSAYTNIRIRTTGFIPVTPGDVISINFTKSGMVNDVHQSASFYTNNSYSTHRNSNTNWEDLGTPITVPSGVSYARFLFKKKDGSNISISDYEYVACANQSKTIKINWQSTAGTVYGGTVTLNEDGSADLVVEYIYGVPDYSRLGANSYNNNGYRTAYSYFGYGALINFPSPYDHTNIISDKAVRGNFITSNTNPVVMNTTGGNSPYIYFGVKSELLESDDLTGLRSYLASLSPVICYQLKEENYTTYHFDNIGSLNSFLGENHIWHNMNDSITVEYYKNT